LRSPLAIPVVAICSAAAGLAPAASASVPFDVSVRGQITERWSADQDPVSDGCGRRTTGSGEATLGFKTAKPYRLTLDSYTGFHSKPAVLVNVDRQGGVSTSTYDDCDQPEPGSSGCGVRSYRSRIDLGIHNPWTKQLLDGDADVFSTPGGDCPLPGDFGVPEGIQADSFETVDLLTHYGPQLRITRKLFGGCDGHGRCYTPHKRTVIHFRKHIDVPFVKAGKRFGSYRADVDWTITTIARVRLPGR
jgi:hypothetical protein